MRPEITVGSIVEHLPTGSVRRVSGKRGSVLHLRQVIKLANGETFYWADESECIWIRNDSSH